ncbi:MAG: glycoside hydrolase family 3 C-terminal domain-containing protein [Marinilabiliaceae bacterium]|jgi:beta-glucosidase|nr:glycoside hydrolase family 3 C-terminal domain-containing protein [Marinilabiliaceae bacterium]
MKLVSVLLFVLLVSNKLIAQNSFPFQDPALSVDERVDDLVSRMTLQEKADQLLYTAPAIPGLGVPSYNWWNEALHGVARSGWATVFPQSITMAASWDTDLMYEVASVISDEARAKYHDYQRRGMRGIYQGLTFWSPNINIFRDPRWGRGHETYGEDPYLTGSLGVEFVKGMQGDDPKYLKTVATAKHYAVHSGPEPLRHEFNARVSEVDLRETYLPAFRALVVDGDVQSIMGAYNQFRDHPCCANEELYSILYDEWGFKGYIVSDCWAISDFHQFQAYTETPAESAALAVKAGTDLNCGVTYRHLKEAVDMGLLTEDDIDVAVSRLMRARIKLGMFDPDSLVPWAAIPLSANCSDYADGLARQAARESIVLLKNGGVLPLKENIKKILVCGPNADNFEALIGNYNGIPRNPVTVLDGLRKRAGDNLEIIYAEGSDLARGIHNLKPVPPFYLLTEDGKRGAFAEYFNNADFEGEPVFTRIDENIDFYWETYSPHPDIPHDGFSVRWTSWFCPPESGEYYLGSWGSSNYEIEFEGVSFINYTGDHHAFHMEKAVQLEAGEKYKIVVKYRNLGGDADIKLLYAPPRKHHLNDLVYKTRDCDAIVAVVGLSQRLEGEQMSIKIDGFEGGDRTNLQLPSEQKQMLEALYKTGKPVIIVLMNGSALAINREQEMADAILLAGYGGQQAGNAVADVLFGDYNPAGRLPVTYYKSVEQLPAFENYDMDGRTYRYFDGEPLYPFGYGLSYTTFEYSGLVLPGKINAGETLEVEFTVKNTGTTDGDEVVQLYLADEKASTRRPLRQLEGFKRIHLKAGESERIKFILEPRQMSIINNEGKRVIEPGWFSISAGGKQPGFQGYADPSFTGTSKGRFKVTGKQYLIKGK